MGVCRNDYYRPDGMSLIPWRQGLLLLWDFTCSDTLTPSNVSTSSRGAHFMEPAKFKKYSSLTTTFYFSPLCVKTLGAWGSSARSLVWRIGSRIMEQTGDNRALQFLIQKIANDVQRGNAASVMATIPSSLDWAEFVSLPLV